jgi:RNA polymerase sigma-70 factor (ECF subfamily)
MSCDLRLVAARIRPFVERRVAADDVDDVLQEVLVRVHREFDAIDDDERFARWLHRVAANAIADHHRRNARRDRKHDAAAAEPRDTAPRGSEPESDDAATTFASFVTYAIDSLPTPYREALHLTELDGLTMAEAAAREGLSVSGMKSRVQRGRRMLRELFEACCEIALDARGRIVEYAPRGGR